MGTPPPTPLPPPPGTLAVIESKRGAFVFLTPFSPVGIRPAIFLHQGMPYLSFCEPPEFASILSQGWVKIERKKERCEFVDRERQMVRPLLAAMGNPPLIEKDLSVDLPSTWKRHFRAWKRALEIAAALWERTGGANPDPLLQKRYAEALMINSVSFAGVFSGKLGRGMPRSPEDFAKTMAILLHWGQFVPTPGLLRSVKHRGSPGLPRTSAALFENAANILNEFYTAGKVAMWDPQWSPFTASFVEGVIDRQDQSATFGR